MKSLVFILVLGNVLLYAFTAGYFGHPDNPDAGRIEQQVAPERMRLVAPSELPAKAVESAPRPPAVPEAAVSAADEAGVCLRWTPLSSDNARQLSAQIAEKFAAYQTVQRPVADDGNGWWVYIPPLPGKAEAEKKAGQLRQFGVSDYFILSDEGVNRYAISLGIFSSEKGAQERLAELKAKGVKSARTGTRPGKSSLVTLEARGPQADREALRKLATATLPKVAAQDCK